MRFERRTTVNWYLRISWAHRQIIGIVPLYSSISLIAKQSHIYQKWHPQRYRLFWLIDHRPLAASPVKECKLFSANVQLRDPNAIGFNLAPCFDKSNKHSPVVVRTLEVRIDSLLSAGFMRIHSMPSLLQSVFFKKKCWKCSVLPC